VDKILSPTKNSAVLDLQKEVNGLGKFSHLKQLNKRQSRQC
jgi:hypothetical protein